MFLHTHAAIVVVVDEGGYPVNALAISTTNAQYGAWSFEMDNGKFLLLYFKNDITVYLQRICFSKFSLEKFLTTLSL